MQVLITRTTVANKQFVRAGDVVDLEVNEAKLLIAIGKAEAVGGDDEPASETAVEAEAEAEATELTTENAEAVVATAAPKGKRRGAK
jgi:hypothetical protein